MSTRMYEKTEKEFLYFCPSAVCKVVTFVKNNTCPHCGEPGLFIRTPIDNRGAPNRGGYPGAGRPESV